MCIELPKKQHYKFEIQTKKSHINQNVSLSKFNLEREALFSFFLGRLEKKEEGGG